MTLMHGHIQAFRALADALEDEADHLTLSAPGSETRAVCRTLKSMATAHRVAAKSIERAELNLLERVTTIERQG